jgi:hypothetical protein
MNDWKFKTKVFRRYLGDDVEETKYAIPEDLADRVISLMEEAHNYLMTHNSEASEKFLEEWPEIASLARTYSHLNPKLKTSKGYVSLIPRVLQMKHEQRVENIVTWIVDNRLDENDSWRKDEQDYLRTIPEVAAVIRRREKDKEVEDEAKAFYDKHFTVETTLVDTTADDPEDETYSWRV